MGLALRNVSGVVLLALQNPLGFGSPLSCWDRDFGWKGWQKTLHRKGGNDVHLPSTQPVVTAEERGPAQRVSILSTKPQKAPPSPQESDAANHPPLTWGESGVPTLKSALSHHSGVLTEIWGITGTTGAPFMFALLPEHPMPGEPPQLQPWQLSCTAPASLGSDFRALLSDTKM